MLGDVRGRARPSLRNLSGVSMASANQKISIFLNAYDKTGKAFKGVTRGIDRVKKSLFSLHGIMALVGGGLMVRELVDASMAMERITLGLRGATGSAQNAAQEFEWLNNEVDRLKIDLRTAGESFMMLTAAARGTSLEGEEVRRMFSSLSQASIVLGMSADQTHGALYALQQMISKGKVTAEELRRQLGDRLPGAFQLAAKAMNMTTAELDEAMRKGEVYAEDFLPKFARVLDQAFSDSLPDALQSTRASVQELSTAWFRFKAEVADSGIVDVMTEVMGQMTELFGSDDIADSIDAMGGAIRQNKEAFAFLANFVGTLAKFLAKDLGKVGDFITMLDHAKEGRVSFLDALMGDMWKGDNMREAVAGFEQMDLVLFDLQKRVEDMREEKSGLGRIYWSEQDQKDLDQAEKRLADYQVALSLAEEDLRRFAAAKAAADRGKLAAKNRPASAAGMSDTEAKLLQDIAKSGMSKADQKIFDLAVKADEVRKKLGDGSQQMVDNWLKAQVAAIRIQQAIKAGEDTPKDFWQIQGEDADDVRSRAGDRLNENENELIKKSIEAGRETAKDSWQLMAEDRQEVLERQREMEAQHWESVTQFGVQAARNIQSSFADFLFDPFEDGLDGMLNSFAKTMQRMAAEVAASQILSGLFGGLAGSDNAFLSGIGKAFGGTIPKNHTGTMSFQPSFRLPGMSHDEGLTTLKRGEAVLTPAQMAAMKGGGGVTVNVINQGGQPLQATEQRQRRGPDGQQVIDVMVKSSIDRLAGSGQLDRTMSTNYGVRRPGRF